MAKNGLNCMLEDKESSINILFGATYDKMVTGHKRTIMIGHIQFDFRETTHALWVLTHDNFFFICAF